MYPIFLRLAQPPFRTIELLALLPTKRDKNGRCEISHAAPNSEHHVKEKTYANKKSRSGM